MNWKVYFPFMQKLENRRTVKVKLFFLGCNILKTFCLQVKKGQIATKTVKDYMKLFDEKKQKEFLEMLPKDFLVSYTIKKLLL